MAEDEERIEEPAAETAPPAAPDKQAGILKLAVFWVVVTVVLAIALLVMLQSSLKDLAP